MPSVVIELEINSPGLRRKKSLNDLADHSML